MIQLLWLLVPVILIPHVPVRAGDCAVTGSATPSQVEQALAACSRARSRLNLLFGEQAPHATIAFVSRPSSDFALRKDSIVMYAPIESGSSHDYGTFQSWLAVAPHEIAHILYDARTGVVHRYGRGHGDWFMEAVAMWAEEDHRRSHRLRQAGAIAPEALSLREVLQLHHPNHADGASLPRGRMRIETNICRVPCPGRPDTLHVVEQVLADGTATVDTVPSSSPVLARIAIATAFYSLSLSILDFVYERGGSTAVRIIEERVRAGRGGVESVEGLPGLPATLDGFEREWRRWLEQAAT